MEFLISRLSDFTDKEKPCKDAVRISIKNTMYPNNSNPYIDEWLIKFATLEELGKFVNEIEKEVILGYDERLGYFYLEIFDDYR